MSTITRYGKIKLKKVLENCTERLKVVMEDLKSARAKGDLSENGEYHAAKEAKGKLEAEITTLENYIKSSIEWNPDSYNQAKIQFGSKVELKINGKFTSYVILSPREADPNCGSLSISSPLYQELSKHDEGDEFAFRDRKYEIISVHRASESEIINATNVVDVSAF